MSDWVAGVDGCPGGWVAAFRNSAGEVRLASFAALAEILEAPEQPAVVAVDIPIGLPARTGIGGRAPEPLVRQRLGNRQSAVFSTPARAAVMAEDYAEACRRALEGSDPPRKVSRQAFMLFPKIREVDALLQRRPDLAGRVFECHPEASFWAMNGERALDLPKKVKGRPHAPGLDLRRRLLERQGFPPALWSAPRPLAAGPDDVLDACAAAWTAGRIRAGSATCWPDPPERDDYGIPVAIRA